MRYVPAPSMLIALFQPCYRRRYLCASGHPRLSLRDRSLCQLEEREPKGIIDLGQRSIRRLGI